MIPLRIFINGVQKEFSAERAALRGYLRGDALMRRFFEVFLFEDVPAPKWRPGLIRKRFNTPEDLVTGLYAALVEYPEGKELLRFGPFDTAPCWGAMPDDLNAEQMTRFIRTARGVRQLPLDEDTPPQDLLRHLNLLNKGRQVVGQAPISGLRNTTQEIDATEETAQETTQEIDTTQETTQEKILVLLRDDPRLTRRALAEQLGITPDGIKYHLGKLRKAGRLRHVGAKKKGRWEILEGDHG